MKQELIMERVSHDNTDIDKREYRISPAIRRGFPLSRVTTNN